jgi:crotonobetainyl-CoA:carnitine CoA-transferase CaiB-like acyl-CoA transferase
LATPVDNDGPLCGLKVRDLTEHMAGPFCTMILADTGPEVDPNVRQLEPLVKV